MEINLEMEYSGASLAFKYFNPTIASEALKRYDAFRLRGHALSLRKLEKIYAYVEDHDLWRVCCRSVVSTRLLMLFCV